MTWRHATLGDFVTLQRGHDLPSQDRVSGSVPIMGSFGITGHHSKARAKGPGVTIGRSGASIGVASYVESDYWPLNTCMYVTDFKGNNPRYAYYLLRTLNLASHNSGSAQPSLNRNYIYPIEISFPERSYQDRVSDLLGSLDDKIELNRRLNETLEAMARALFRDWFVNFGPTRRQTEGATDPVDILGDAFPPKKSIELARLFPKTLGEDGLPTGWTKKPVGELSKIVGGGTPNTKAEEFWKNGVHLWATPRDLSKLSGVFIRSTERLLTDAGLAKVSSGLSPAGSVLISSRAPIGYLAIASEPIAVNQGFIVLRPTKTFPTHFAKLWCEANMETIEANANGSTFQEISKRNFKPILATVPCRSVMEAFSEYVGLLFAKIEANEKQNETLVDIRDLLLPKLISGEIRLRDAETIV